MRTPRFTETVKNWCMRDVKKHKGERICQMR